MLPESDHEIQYALTSRDVLCMSCRQQLQVTLTLARELQIQSKDWADFGGPVHKDKPNNEGLNSTA